MGPSICGPMLVAATGRTQLLKLHTRASIDHILTRTLLPEMSAEFLSRLAEGEAIQGVEISVSEEGGFHYEIS